MRLRLAAAFFFVGAGLAAAQQPPVAPPAPASASQSAKPAAEKLSYAAHVDRIKHKHPEADYGALRLAFAETEAYSPYGRDSERRTAFRAAMNDLEFAEALQIVQKSLEENYADIRAHLNAAEALKNLGDIEKSDFHRAVAVGLVESILKSGDGKSAKTACVVISTEEEYMVLNYLGLRSKRQALLHLDGHFFDRLTAVHPSGEEVELFFNIDLPFTHLAKSRNKK